LVIVLEFGDLFWIERLEVSVTLPDAAGSSQSSIIPLEKSGNFLGAAIAIGHALNDNNVQAIGATEIRQGAGGQILLNDFLPDIRLRVRKQVGTAGNTTVIYNVMLFMRRPAR